MSTYCPARPARPGGRPGLHGPPWPPSGPPRGVPRDAENDYAHAIRRPARREFLREQTGASLAHVGQFSFDPGVLPGNIENFAGVAQVPIGVAGPLRINGEHARGEFFVPLATTEGTLVASYNRGMRLLNACGGVKTTVVEDTCSAHRSSSSTTPWRRASSAIGSAA